MKKVLSVIAVSSLILALGACSSSQTSEDGAIDGDVASADAGTDAVPTDAAETPQGDVASIDGQTADPAAVIDPAATTDQPVATAEGEQQAVAAAEGAMPTEEQVQPVAEQATQQLEQVVNPATNPEPTFHKPVARVAASEQTASDAPRRSGGHESYTVQNGDTLMKIAFEQYGDLYRWKEIYEANRDQIKNPNKIYVGSQLKLEKSSMVARNGRGEKYQIKQGDTLGTISHDVYGTESKWRKIWNNNKQSIPNPNKIFAGFYLYYTFNEQDRKELEQYRGQTTTNPAPLAHQPGQNAGRAPASAQPAGK